MPRLISGAVEVRGRMLVSISLDTAPEPNFAVATSTLTEPDSRTSGVPSLRQKVSASSVSTRLHWGQRFMRYEFSPGNEMFQPCCAFATSLRYSGKPIRFTISLKRGSSRKLSINGSTLSRGKNQSRA